MSLVVNDDLIGMSAHRAAAMVGIGARRLKRWESYGLVTPSVTEVVGGRTIRLYGFRQLVDLLVVGALERITNDVRKLRRVLDDLQREYDSPWSQLRWAYDGHELYWQHPDGSWAGDRNPGQTVLHGVIDLQFIEATVRDSVRRRESSLGQTEARRGVLGSKPVIAGTRTPVDAVQEFIDAGCDDEQILKAYPHLTSQDIRAVRAS